VTEVLFPQNYHTNIFVLTEIKALKKIINCSIMNTLIPVFK